MQILGFSPSFPIAVFAQVMHDQTHVVQIADLRFRVPEPEATDVVAHQGLRLLNQVRRSRDAFGFGGFKDLAHEETLPAFRSRSKPAGR